MLRIGINGFGRIGRLALRYALTTNEIEVVAINDLASAKNLAYLLKYDTAHGEFKNQDIRAEDNFLILNDKKILITSNKDPNDIKWNESKVDIVLECTGFFRTKESASKHLKEGVKGVIISAPGDSVTPMFVYGVNHNEYNIEDKVISAASCTTNCLAPIADVIDEHFGITSGLMTTVHAYTTDQTVLDMVKEKDFRRGRAAASNIVPTSTGAAKAIGKVLPRLNNVIDGLALRVPVINASCVDLTLTLRKDVSEEEINQVVKQSSLTKYKDIIEYSSDPLVSSDIMGKSCPSVFDSKLTRVFTSKEGKTLVKVLVWYDNEYSYAAQLVRLATYVGRKNV